MEEIRVMVLHGIAKDSVSAMKGPRKLESAVMDLWAEVDHSRLSKGLPRPHWTPVFHLLDWSKELSGLPGMSGTIADLLSDVPVYLMDRERVEKSILASIEKVMPHVIVAHSLGSVAALGALARTRGLNVRCLITIGSPWRLSVFSELVGPAVDTLQTRVGQWVDIVEPGDWICDGGPMQDGLLDWWSIRNALVSLLEIEASPVSQVDPLTAHSCYWDHEAVAGEVLAQCSRAFSWLRCRRAPGPR